MLKDKNALDYPCNYKKKKTKRKDQKAPKPTI
jgi:hypothetical protein